MSRLLTTLKGARGARLSVAGGLICLALFFARDASAQATLLDGFGGAAGYGATFLDYNDDGSTPEIDISAAFPAGANFFGTPYSSLWVNNNGNMTFSGPVTGYTPTPFPTAAVPMLAPFWGDVDTSAGEVAGFPGSDRVYYHVDTVPVRRRFITTWYLVGYYDSHTDQLNSFQAILTNRDDIAPGDFDIEYRFNRCEWVTGDASGGTAGHGGTPAQSGYDAGDSTNYWSHPDSQTEAIVDLCTTSNVGIPGVWQFLVRSGAPEVCGDGILTGAEECDDGNVLPNDGCTGCVIYADADIDTFYADVDCDDTDDAIYPGAPELCDGLDNDCDTDIDEGLTTDSDGDGFTDIGSCSGTADDCDDSRSDIYPGATELCDGVDNDCDTDIDEGLTTDGDGDGFTDIGSCSGTADDCDDSRSDIYPGATEICNSIDDDCDGDIDEGLTTDADGDGHTTVGSCAGPSDDCDDSNADIYTGAPELCDGLDNDCDGVVPAVEADDDGDGWSECAGDCDDLEPAVHPGAAEICDGLDNDCDGATDESVDGDGDGFTICDGDCDDGDADIHPDAEEICNGGIDDDCDPSTDEDVDSDGDGLSVCDGDCDDESSDSYPGATEICDGLDNDCDGDLPADEADADEDGQMGCEGDCDDTDDTVGTGFPELCDGIDNDCDGDILGETEDVDEDGFTPCEGDCNDTVAHVFPGAPEICDGLDNDCDGVIPADEMDEDADGFRICDGDCDDTAADTYPGAEELCDGIDNDCDGSSIEDELDGDGDGFSICDGDCDDTDDTVYPGAPELCDGIDNDCDGEATGEEDEDGDGYRLCDDDCDDDDATTYPGAPELCDGIDNDCDGDAGDEEIDADGDGLSACEGDCDDTDPDTYPGADDPPNGVDNDCDGIVPEPEGNAGLAGGACGCRAAGQPSMTWTQRLLALLAFFL